MSEVNNKGVKVSFGGNNIILPVSDPVETKDVVVDDVDKDPIINDPPVDKPDDTSSDKVDTTVELAENDSLEVVLEDGSKVTGTINKEGNLIDSEGKIILTKDALSASSVDDDTEEIDAITVEDISRLSGIQLLDVEGKPITYENSVEGLAKREADVKRLGYQEGQQKALEVFFNEYPEFGSMFRYMKTYGNLENYSDFVDFSKVTLDSTNESQLLDIIKKAEIAKGSNPERAARIANFAKTDNTLMADAQASLEYLKNTQESRNRDADNIRAKEQADIEKAEQNYYGVTVDNGKIKSINVKGSIYDKIVNEGRVGDYIIPKDGIKIKDKNNTIINASREDLFKYIYVPVADINGQLLSQAQLDQYNKLSDTDELLKSFILNFTGGNLDSLINAKVQNETVKRIKLSRNKTTGKSSNNTGSKVIIKLGS